MSGVVSAGFSTTVLPVASAGASFHAAISSGKFHGMIWPATPSGAACAPGERVLELVRPARVVEEVRGGERQIDVARFLDRLAAVHRLEHRELARPLLELPRDAEHVLRALGPGERLPARRGVARRIDSRVDVGRRRPRRPRRGPPRWTGSIVGNHRPLFGSTNSPPMNKPYRSCELHDAGRLGGARVLPSRAAEPPSGRSIASRHRWLARLSRS